MPGRQALLTGPTGATEVAGIIGDPVRHSISPAIHNAAYQALGVDWVYVAFPVPAGQGANAVDAMRVLGLAGLSVTMPHKAAVVHRVDRLERTAARLGVANTITRRDGDGGWELVGDSTDGSGFLSALREDDGFDPAGKRCLVLGTGGAGRSVILSLADAGAASVEVVGRRPEQVASGVELAGPSGAAVDLDGSSLEKAVEAADLVVNATPVGMTAGDGLPFGLVGDWFRADQVVVDLIYLPATTPLISAARERGALASNGLGMLIHQAARQIGIWTGRVAPLDVMSAAALAALSRREAG
ncbi:MAG TPA: shikimate dehydrogenase [Acidimicrobiales bacterium]|nr:shikimate dehydrogenase [Acidimicrobiales bacterium]